MNLPLKFQYIPYPRWRKHWPLWARSAMSPLWDRWYPFHLDANPPQTAVDMADVLVRYRLAPDMSLNAIHAALNTSDAVVTDARHLPPPPILQKPANPVRLPAQWEPMEAIILTWPIFYPPLWALHAAMAEAIAPVADVTITVPAPLWAHAIWLYLKGRDLLGENASRVTFVVMPTDDIWVRDYGPITGYDADGERVVFDAIYDHLPHYPQTRDDHMPRFWAAHMEAPVCPLDLHTEGGNLWTDGAGTLIMTERIFEENPNHSRASLADYLHSVFDFEQIIYLPRLQMESTGHVDLLVKLAGMQTALVSAPGVPFTDSLRAAAAIMRKATNAQGAPYDVIALPTPPPYWNWIAYPIRRSYTNALTVNGRVLVPVYGLRTDEEALRIYERAMPDHAIIPIDCAVGANGGGAVHCMTKEVPAAR